MVSFIILQLITQASIEKIRPAAETIAADSRQSQALGPTTFFMGPKIPGGAPVTNIHIGVLSSTIFWFQCTHNEMTSADIGAFSSDCVTYRLTMVDPKRGKIMNRRYIDHCQCFDSKIQTVHV